jgi:type IV pilus assembly protein PilY1
MKRLLKMLTSVLASAVLGAGGARAEDIDVFSAIPGGGLPNVLFIVDNTANWNNVFGNEMAALYNTFMNLPVNADGSAKFNIGIMFATETGSPNTGAPGGYVRAAIRPMTAANKALYAAMIQNFDWQADRGNGGHASLQMAEAYRYFSGAAPYAGNGKIKADFFGNYCVGCNNLTSPQITADNAVYALAGNALTGEYATAYNAPPSGSCGQNYIIYVSNGPPKDNNSSTNGDAQATDLLKAAGGDATTIPISPTSSMTNPSDEWARFMHSNSLGVVTYTIDVDPSTKPQGLGWTALLQSMANVSNGKYTAVSSDTGGGQQIADAMAGDLSEMQSVNSAFASVSLPVSVNTQGSYLNRVFIGMFRPDPNAAPRWMGNLKQYKLGIFNNALSLEDSANQGAINNLTGFITACAQSFWTPVASDTYWSQFGAEGLCILPNNTQSNSPDGDMVEKGGQGYLLRGGSSYGTATSSTRTVKTCSPTFSSCTISGGTLTPDDFSTGTNTSPSYITQSLLDPTGTVAAADLINWARGANIDSANKGDFEYRTGYGIRPSVHGDVVHSRPVALNYGSDGTPQIVVFYGANDGLLRAVNGNRDGENRINGAVPGAEIWSFMPPEFYGNIARLYNNKPAIALPTAAVSSALPKNYGMDGPLTINTDNSHVWVYAPMRRGGRALYAFDATSPSNITLKWKIGCPSNFPTSGTVDDTNCSTGFSGIGQTWSSAKTIKTAGSSATLLIMGGGYDPCEDSDPNSCTASTKGNKVFVLDADTGSLLRTFDTDRAVIADIAVVPDTLTGLAIYAYAVDLGGNIYRITIGANTPGNWSMVKIASLGCATPDSCPANRKFMFAPDVVLQNGIYTLLLGSGDREKPLVYTTSGSVVNAVTNAFFAVQDNPNSSTWLSAETSNCGSNIAVLCLSSLYAVPATANGTPVSLGSKKGWYITLATREQVVTSAITIYGIVYFSTHQPTTASATSCKANLGNTRVYNVNLNLSQITSTLLPPVGLPPSPVAGMVTLDDGQTVVFCVGCSPASPLQATQPQAAAGTVPAQPKSRVYWYIQR